MRRWGMAVAGCAALVAAGAAARAAGNTCFYNGKKWDDRYGRPTDFTGEYTCKDMDTGKLTLREHHVRGVRDGEYAKYDARSGKLEETGRYRDDRMDGVMRRYSDGTLFLELNYAAGKLAGVQKEYEDGALSRVYLVDENGRPDTQLHFNKKKQLTMLECRTRPIGKEDAVWCGFNGKQSTVTLYDEEGRTRAVVQYLAGREHGVHKKLNIVTGAVMEEVRYEGGKRLSDGERTRDRNGALLVKTDCDAKGACTETQLFDGGKQPHLVTVRNGERLIKRTEYYQNGRPREELVADGGRFRIAAYSDEGRLVRKGTYLEGDLEWSWSRYVPDGVVESYHDDGTLAARETYARGQRQGHCERFWTKDGKKLHEEAEYDKDKLVREKQYVDGALTSEAEYFPDGSVKSRREHPASRPPTKMKPRPAPSAVSWSP